MFEEIARAGPPAKMKVAPDKVAMMSRTYPVPPRAGGGRRAGLKVFIGAAVMKRLGWKADAAVKLLWGRDIDHGKLKAVPLADGAPGGWTLRRNKAATIWILETSALPAADAEPPALRRADKPWPLQTIGHEVNDAARPADLVLYLPAGYLVKPADKATAAGRR